MIWNLPGKGARSPGMKYILPNTDGLAYGMFLPDSLSMEYMLHNLARFEAEETRLSLLMTLYENMLAGNLSGDAFTQALIRYLPAETNNLVRNSALSYLADATPALYHREKRSYRSFLLETAANTKEDKEYRLLAYRTLTGLFTDSLITKRLFEQWDNGKSFDELPFAETEMTSLAYQLMIRLPEKASYICEKQLERITNPDRRKAFAASHKPWIRTLLPGTPFSNRSWKLKTGAPSPGSSRPWVT